MKEMEVYTLPDFFAQDALAEVSLVDYRSSQENVKQKVNLGQNTISFLQEGTKQVFTGGKLVHIQSSDFLVMRSGHCLMTEKLSSKNKRYRSILLFFSNEAIQEFTKKHLVDRQEKTSPETVVAIPYDDFIRKFVASLIDISTLAPATRSKMVAIKLEEILLYLLEVKGADFIDFLLLGGDDRFRKFTSVVENNTLNKLSLQELAFLSNMSISSFKREFEKHYGESPIKWFQNKRLEHSAFLLKSKSKRATEVFEDAGYENLSSYIQAFKSKYGVTPKQYQSG